MVAALTHVFIWHLSFGASRSLLHVYKAFGTKWSCSEQSLPMYLRRVIYSLYFGISLSLTIATWITGWCAAEGHGADSWPVSCWERDQQYDHRWQRKITGMWIIGSRVCNQTLTSTWVLRCPHLYCWDSSAIWPLPVTWLVFCVLPQ